MDSRSMSLPGNGPLGDFLGRAVTISSEMQVLFLRTYHIHQTTVLLTKMPKNVVLITGAGGWLGGIVCSPLVLHHVSTLGLTTTACL
jgi:FlaA1/EpsC-like NDP-sugar epimerase